MFYHLEGKVAELGQNLIVLDCGGIGFAVNATVNTQSRVKNGERVKLYISEAIGESNFDLYGFYDQSEKHCFELLTGVSGIGPKAALSILSYNSPESLALAILNDDVKALIVAPGIGKKIAQRVILELKDKIGKEMGGSDWSMPAAVSVPAAQQDHKISDAITALMVLGYSSAEVTPVIKTLDTGSMSAEEIIKAVLRQMVKG